ncbi:MAG: hypothetical protein NZV14_05585 [Bryobacteraceae bacterium]|nr:hypothetical protein [Bryobacteraceae bacterium]MDW8377610.1 hypothetical protein [Bryobacterales bacterium]
MAAPWWLGLAWTAATLSVEAPLRSGCETEDREIARLPAGQQVEIRSAISGGAGRCYKIVAKLVGVEVSGYVPASLLRGDGSFEQARRRAQGFDAGARNPSEVKVPAASILQPAQKDHPARKALEQIQAKQPAEALRMLDVELKKRPRNAYLWAVAGLAYFQSDELERAILAFRESLNLEPHPGVEQLLKRALREKEADKGSERMSGVRVVLRYERGSVSAELARAMVEVLDQEYTRISAQLGCRGTERLTAIAQRRETYLQSTAAAEWSGGMYDGRIHVPVMEAPKVTEALRQVFAHELVHACLAELGAWPAWLQEGLAQKFSGETLDPEQRAVVLALLKARQLPRLAELGTSFSRFSAGHARLAYAYAYVAAEKLLELNANVGLWNLLRNPSELSRYTAEVEKALGF